MLVVLVSHFSTIRSSNLMNTNKDITHIVHICIAVSGLLIPEFN